MKKKKEKKKETSNPKLFYSAPLLSLHCTLMSLSVPGTGLLLVGTWAAVLPCVG